MKKKFLSLMMAAAVVATTSVSAFASDANVTGSDNVDADAEVEITGKVLSDNGSEPVGNFKVTVPTAAAFTVGQDGSFTAPEKITIKNAGDQNIDVFAKSFVDTNKNGGISVVGENRLKDLDRTNVSLSVTGNMGTVFLGSAPGANNKGLYSDKNLTEQTGEFQLASILSGQNKDLTLNGFTGGNQADLSDDVKAKGVKDKFTLVLKIKKSSK